MTTDYLYDTLHFDGSLPHHKNAQELIQAFRNINDTVTQAGSYSFDPRDKRDLLDIHITPDAIAGLIELSERIGLRNPTILLATIGEDYVLVQPSLHRPQTEWLYNPRRKRTRREVLPRAYVGLLALADYLGCYRRNTISIPELVERIGIGDFCIRLNPVTATVPDEHYCSCGEPGFLFVQKANCKCNFNNGYHVFLECSTAQCNQRKGIHRIPD